MLFSYEQPFLNKQPNKQTERENIIACTYKLGILVQPLNTLSAIKDYFTSKLTNNHDDKYCLISVCDSLENSFALLILKRSKRILERRVALLEDNWCPSGGLKQRFLGNGGQVLEAEPHGDPHPLSNVHVDDVLYGAKS